MNKEDFAFPQKKENSDVPVQNPFLPVMLLKLYVSKEET